MATFFDIPRADTGKGILDRYGNAFIDGVENGLNGILPRTQTRLNHALLIRVKGRGIGAVLEFSTAQSLEVKDENEIIVSQTGDTPMHPNHLTVQAQTGRTIRVRRADLYGDLCERVFAGDYLDMLGDQRYRFDLDEVWREPGGAIFGGAQAWTYRGCLWESLDRSNITDGDRVSQVSGTIRWAWRQRLT